MNVLTSTFVYSRKKIRNGEIQSFLTTELVDLPRSIERTTSYRLFETKRICHIFPIGTTSSSHDKKLIFSVRMIYCLSHINSRSKYAKKDYVVCFSYESPVVSRRLVYCYAFAFRHRRKCFICPMWHRNFAICTDHLATIHSQ